MSVKAVQHGTFTIERSYPARPKDVFVAWIDPAIKARWFTGPDNWFLIRRETDAHIGGHEILHGSYQEGAETIFKARYHEIVRNELLVYTYDMYMDQEHCSVSLASVEISQAARATRLVYTEHAIFLDDCDNIAAREHLVASYLDRLTPLLNTLDGE